MLGFDDFDEKDYDDIGDYEEEVWQESYDDVDFDALAEEKEEQQEFTTSYLKEGEISQYTRESNFGIIRSTTAEGKFGKKLLRSALASRTDRERIIDNISTACRDLEIGDYDRDMILKNIDNIKDLKYKNPVGIIFGYLMKSYIGKIGTGLWKDKGKDKEGRKKLSSIDERSISDIRKKVSLAREKGYRVSELDIVRYGTLFYNSTTGK